MMQQAAQAAQQLQGSFQQPSGGLFQQQQGAGAGLDKVQSRTDGQGGSGFLHHQAVQHQPPPFAGETTAGHLQPLHSQPCSSWCVSQVSLLACFIQGACLAARCESWPRPTPPREAVLVPPCRTTRAAGTSSEICGCCIHAKPTGRDGAAAPAATKRAPPGHAAATPAGAWHGRGARWAACCQHQWHALLCALEGPYLPCLPGRQLVLQRNHSLQAQQTQKVSCVCIPESCRDASLRSPSVGSAGLDGTMSPAMQLLQHHQALGNLRPPLPGQHMPRPQHPHRPPPPGHPGHIQPPHFGPGPMQRPSGMPQPPWGPPMRPPMHGEQLYICRVLQSSHAVH